MFFTCHPAKDKPLLITLSKKAYPYITHSSFIIQSKDPRDGKAKKIITAYKLNVAGNNYTNNITS